MTLLGLPLMVALVVVALLTAGGMAVRSVSRIWLRHWAERQLRGSGAAVTYLERPHRLLTAASAGVGLTLLVAGMIVGMDSSGLSVVWKALTFAGFVVVFGQILPRAGTTPRVLLLPLLMSEPTGTVCLKYVYVFCGRRGLNILIVGL